MPVSPAWSNTKSSRIEFQPGPAWHSEQSAGKLSWTEKIELPGVMDLVEVDDAIEMLDNLMLAGAPRTPTGT